MLKVPQISNDPWQKQNLILPDGSLVGITVRFVPMQYGWFFDEITRNDFTLYGLRITNSPNMLHQFRNKIPFGIACYSQQNREPSQQDDFISGASTLYLLSEEEVAEYTAYLNE